MKISIFGNSKHSIAMQIFTMINKPSDKLNACSFLGNRLSSLMAIPTDHPKKIFALQFWLN